MSNEEAIAVLLSILPKGSRGNGKSQRELLITMAILMAVESLKGEK